MDLKNFTAAISQIAEEKGIPQNKVFEIIETAVAAAYKKDYGEKGQIIKAKLNPKTGQADFWQEKMAVTEDMLYSEEELEEIKEKGEEAKKEEKVRLNPEKHVMLKEAKKENPKIKAGEFIKIPLNAKKDYGRIAAQTAKQVILQKIREAERDVVLTEYKSKEGELISGVIQRIEGRNIFVDVGKTLGLMPKEEQVPNEFYRPGQRLKFFLMKVEESPKGPVVFLSRAYPKIVTKLFELEVPEISQGSVEIKAIAREAGSRSKVAVISNEEGIDPIGSAVGQRGTRIMAVINELGGEKIDIIEYSDDPEEFIANALSPAKASEVKLEGKNKALCIVPGDQLSLAIGKNGQNVRLAAKLTGWKIDIQAPEGEEVKVEKQEEEQPKKGSKNKKTKKRDK